MDDAALSAMYPSMVAPATEPAAETMLTAGQTAAAPKNPPPSVAEASKPAMQKDAPPADPVGEAAKKLYKQDEPVAHATESTPAHIREMRESDPARKQFDVQAMRKDAVPDDTFDTVAGDGITDEVRQAAVREWRECVADVGISNAEAQQFTNLYRQNVANPPTPEESAKWRAESIKLLRERYGAQWESAAALGEKLLHRDPRVAQLITNGRLSGHPRVVQMVVEAAHREAVKGRLK